MYRENNEKAVLRRNKYNQLRNQKESGNNQNKKYNDKNKVKM